MAMKKVYISGRISGLPREQYMKHFAEAERILKEQGFNVVNPTRLWTCRWYPQMVRLLGLTTAYNITILYDLWRMLKCDNIYKIPGWQQSRGANIESCVAYHLNIWPVRQSVITKLDIALSRIIRSEEQAQESKPQTTK